MYRTPLNHFFWSKLRFSFNYFLSMQLTQVTTAIFSQCFSTLVSQPFLFLFTRRGSGSCIIWNQGRFQWQSVRRSLYLSLCIFWKQVGKQIPCILDSPGPCAFLGNKLKIFLGILDSSVTCLFTFLGNRLENIWPSILDSLVNCLYTFPGNRLENIYLAS